MVSKAMIFSVAGYLPEKEYKWHLCFIVCFFFFLQLFCKSFLGPVLDCLVHPLKEGQPRRRLGPCVAESFEM